jgi:hypothetical protein
MDLLDPDHRFARLVPLLLIAVVSAVLRSGGDASSERALSDSVVMNVSGGFAGVHEVVVVRPNGTYLADTGWSEPIRGRLSADDLAALVHAVNGADLARPTAPGLRHVCCDQFHYTFSYAGHHYTTVDGRVPAEVNVLLNLMGPLLRG